MLCTSTHQRTRAPGHRKTYRNTLLIVLVQREGTGCTYMGRELIKRVVPQRLTRLQVKAIYLKWVKAGRNPVGLWAEEWSMERRVEIMNDLGLLIDTVESLRRELAVMRDEVREYHRLNA